MDVKDVVRLAHQNSKDHGFWDGEQNLSEKLMLIVTEVSEACECLRGASRERFPESDFLDAVDDTGFSQYHFDLTHYPDVAFQNNVKDTFPDELADIVIRVADLAGYLGYDLDRHIQLKMEYNASRPKKHGKNF